MKKQLLLCLTLVLGLEINAFAKNSVTISVSRQGSLSEQLKKYDALTSLKVCGALSSEDVKSIARFVTYANGDSPVATGGLMNLDLSQATLSDFNSGLELNRVVKGSASLRTIVLGNTYYVAYQTFYDAPNLKTIEFNGNIGHMDGYLFGNLPKLERVTFRGAVISTGGYEFFRNCPRLKKVEFLSPLINANIGEPIECPLLKGYTVKTPVVKSSADFIATTTDAKILKAYNWAPVFDFFMQWADKSCNERFFSDVVKGITPTMIDLAELLGDTANVNRLQAYIVVNEGEDAGKSKMEILKESAPYVRTGQTAPVFTYASPNDSLLTLTRNFFDLDKVAGQGDELSKIKNLLYWVHDLVRHDGSSSWPNCRYNCIDLYKVCQSEKRGLNCRFMAIMLCEALLAEGIPARYLTCQSKNYDTDSDCHVITVAWSRQLNKWVWVDPTFCAYVTDENGLWLHPGEVRERLRHGQPLVLNSDANWNHESLQTKEEYLEQYMAKNLYLITSNLKSMSEPESKRSNNGFITLIPDGFDYNHGATTTDDAYFWQAPPKELVK